MTLALRRHAGFEGLTGCTPGSVGRRVRAARRKVHNDHGRRPYGPGRTECTFSSKEDRSAFYRVRCGGNRRSVCPRCG